MLLNIIQSFSFTIISRKLIRVIIDNIINNNTMNYNTLQSLLPNDEINYISDSTQFFIDNKIKSKQFKNNTFILFEYTIDYIDNTIKQLNKNNIKYSIHTDDLDLQYIII